jgi:triosephosphate isomerase
MKPILIVFNLKSYKTEEEAKLWLQEINLKKNINFANKEIIVCPSFTLLPLFNLFIKKNSLPIRLGAQNVSPFDEGAFTGEENAKQIKEFADFVLIGHSERRNNFNETDDILKKKVEMSLKYGLIPIYIIQKQEDIIPAGVKIVAYEPIFAIGSANPDSPENADKIAFSVNSKDNKYNVLYGGSVTAENVREFTKMENISGVLVGKASLDANEFIRIIKNA